jgi:hypothetical protein
MERKDDYVGIKNTCMKYLVNLLGVSRSPPNHIFNEVTGNRWGIARRCFSGFRGAPLTISSKEYQGNQQSQDPLFLLGVFWGPPNRLLIRHWAGYRQTSNRRACLETI